MIKLPDWTKNTELSQICIRTSQKVAQGSLSYIRAIWKRIINWKSYPLDCINIYECQGKYSLYHFQNNILIHSQNITVKDQDWKEYIKRHKNLPLYFIVQGQDCEFRSLPTKQLQIWDRFLLLNQIKTNEFKPNDLVSRYQLKYSSEKIDVFVSIRANDQLLQIFKILHSFKNPICGILSWDLEQSLIMKKYAGISNLTRAWIVTIIPIDKNQFTILILFQEKILLQRIISISNAEDLEKEIYSTLKFLQRQGYTEGQAVSVLMQEEINIRQFSNAALEVVHVPKKLLDKFTFKPRNPFLKFVPKMLFEPNLSYELPKKCIKYLIPLNLIFLILWSIIQIKSFFQNYEEKWQKTRYEKIHSQIPKNFTEQLYLSKIFPPYLESTSKSPNKLILTIHKLLKNKAQVSSIKWDFSEKTLKLYLKFSPLNQKSSDLKKYIHNNAERILGKVTLTWQEEGKDINLFIQQKGNQHDN